MQARLRFTILAALLLCFAPTVPAARAAVIPLHEGMLSTADETVLAAVGWDGLPDGKKADNGFEISYRITLDAENSMVSYVYGISGVGGTSLSKALSHFIVETSPSFTSENILAGTTPRWELRSDADPVHTTWAGETGTAGLKWDTWGDPLAASFTIITDRMPMPGTFYAKSGNGTYARANGSFYVPDTLGADIPTVPAPSAVWTGIALLTLLAVCRHCRRPRAA